MVTGLDWFRPGTGHTPGPGWTAVPGARLVERDPGLAEVLSRLEVAAAIGDPDAAARLLDSLAAGAGGPCGVWLHRQIGAAALRAVAQAIAT